VDSYSMNVEKKSAYIWKNDLLTTTLK